ncbi:hypothetical protein SBA6_830001 [Candidatus Sulfopaludibacter sp. SbA6]|nr:hypothetical protein SBA6_830001 [Candidatus Sulfopaludibacter sp. SbA6]
MVAPNQEGNKGCGIVYPGSMRKAVCGLLLLLHSLVWAQGVHPISGRKYANVMGANGAGWLVRPERETEEQPDAALDAIGIAKGATVADVGAGAGYITSDLLIS